MKFNSNFVLILLLSIGLWACEPGDTYDTVPRNLSSELLNKYAPFRLDVNLDALSDNQRQLVAKLIEAGNEIDAMYWQQAYGDREDLLKGISDPASKKFAVLNFGPWDRLDGNNPFIAGVGEKPKGANFYPSDMTEDEFDKAARANEALRGLYTMVRRNEAGNLAAIPYNIYFREHTDKISSLLTEAAALAEDPGFKRYLELRAEAISSDIYYDSDMAWMEMKDNMLEVVIGPIETYEDQLFGYKAAYETFVLLKDLDWSGRLTKYAALLPGLQRGLPVPRKYKSETPGSESDLGAYDVLFTSGDANAGSKTIAINLPNDERVQLRKGTRRLQLKNIMQAKFEKILEPIADMLVADAQRDHVKFDAFFGNTMFHEVAHGLGIKNTISGNGTVRQALLDHASKMEEGKADVLGLYMVQELIDQGEWEGELMDHYTTFMVSIFRSIRFGSSSAHAQANLIRFNYFEELGAFSFDRNTGKYAVNPDAMAEAIRSLSERILMLQGDGNYDEVDDFVSEYAVLGPDLTADLERLSNAGIPVDIIYEQ
ncbi:MAG: Zn-dependent hydrolase [Rhodothermales bacterium]